MKEVRFLRLPEVLKRVGLSRSQVYRMIQTGEFPAPKKIGSHISVWSDKTIEEWQEEVINSSG